MLFQKAGRRGKEGKAEWGRSWTYEYGKEVSKEGETGSIEIVQCARQFDEKGKKRPSGEVITELLRSTEATCVKKRCERRGTLHSAVLNKKSKKGGVLEKNLSRRGKNVFGELENQRKLRWTKCWGTFIPTLRTFGER